uniref:Ent-copalyl diphosphate synthase n=1 Tax=Vittaria appalachiana TaxID=57323 RepID=A0A8U0D9P2_9MONI|nr:ent-copalyl diphosphate synthase [Vittaria appalachiana]
MAQAVPNARTAILLDRPLIDQSYTKELHLKLSKPFIDDDVVHEVQRHNDEEMQQLIMTIKGMFQTMTFGEISISAYDTAWVAMVPSLDGSNKPQFPQCLKWIIDNQFYDGSWGDGELFLAYDRVCSTVACLVTLKLWNVGHQNIEKGVNFVRNNISKMNHEAEDYMPIGFEVVFPTMMDDAKALGLNLPYDAPIVKKFREEQTKKLNRIPMDLLHSQPTTLLHSLEGLHRVVDWKKLLKLQSKNGSFLFSPASTACALKYTGDKQCLNYLTSILRKFKNAVPNVYPVDLFEHLWVVDRLERLGISRYFEKEIKKCMDYVFQHWKEEGIAWASESRVTDVDDTAMAFRLLRLHGFPVSADVFKRFKKGNEFFCFEGQTSQAVTGMHNLYRASQTMLPNESILKEAYAFTRSFLLQRQKQNKIHDKWLISKGLKGEVEYSLESPWYESLPRMEARNYISHYGVDDIWIGKSLYRMFFVNNKIFLNLAILDYNFCQSLHQRELAKLVRWYDQSQLALLQIVEKTPMDSFFEISATLFEPKYAFARNVWAMCNILQVTIKSFFTLKGSLKDLDQFLAAIRSWDSKKAKNFSPELQILFSTLYNTINSITQMASVAQGHDMGLCLRSTWERYVISLLAMERWKVARHTPALKEFMHNARASFGIEPIVASTLFFLHETLHEEDLQHESFHSLIGMVATAGQIKADIQSFNSGLDTKSMSCVALHLHENSQKSESEAIQHFLHLHEETMRLLVQECLQSTSLPKQCKKLLFYASKISNFLYSNSKSTMSTSEACDYHANLTLFTPIPQDVQSR